MMMDHAGMLKIVKNNACNGVEVIGHDIGEYPEEIWWSIQDCEGNEIISGGVPFDGCVSNLPSDYVIVMEDGYGDGWNGNNLTIGNESYTLNVGWNGYDYVGFCDGLVGCMDSAYPNFCEECTVHDPFACEGSGVLIPGCTNPMAENYDTEANEDDGSCIIFGCMDSTALNYNEWATNDNDPTLCEYQSIIGCTDSLANNYNSEAVGDDGSCEYDCSLSIESSITGGFCSGSTADIIIYVNGGSGNYSYSWSNDSGVGIANLNLSEGVYNIVVTDNQTGCIITEEFDLTFDQIELSTSIEYIMGSCANVSVDVVGGTPLIYMRQI